MTFRPLPLALALLAGCAAEASTPAPTTKSAPQYEVRSKENTGSGPFEVHLACNGAGDEVVGGSCDYLNVTPEPGDRSGVDEHGWFCAGVAPEMTPYGWVNLRIVCSPAAPAP